MAAKGQKPNTIKRTDIFKVFKWLETHWQEIGDKSLTMQQVAQQATQEIGIPISWVNIRNIVRDLGKPWPGKYQVKRKGSSHEANAINQKLDLIAKEVIKLIQFITDAPGSASPQFNLETLQRITRHESMESIRQSVLPFNQEKKA